MNRNPLSAFIVASSLPITIWPLAGLAIAVNRNSAEFNFSIAAITIPLIFGLYHAALVYFGVPSKRKPMLIAGAVLGLILSSLGTFVLNVPEQVYGLQGNSQYLALIGGPIFYGAIWGFALVALERRVGFT